MKLNCLLLSGTALFWAAISPAVASPPVIKPTTSFNSQSVFAGSNATFTNTAIGEAPLSYQWRKEDADLLTLADWQDYLTNAQSPVTLEADDPISFYRVVEP